MEGASYNEVHSNCHLVVSFNMYLILRALHGFTRSFIAKLLLGKLQKLCLAFTCVNGSIYYKSSHMLNDLTVFRFQN